MIRRNGSQIQNWDQTETEDCDLKLHQKECEMPEILALTSAVVLEEENEILEQLKLLLL